MNGKYHAYQLSYFADHATKAPILPLTELGDLGTFKDSLKAPIHRWFKYPAGYSHKLVTALFEHFQIEQRSWVYDPFSGSGTTLIVAKQAGLNGYGVEAHSFVHWVAQVKLFWEFDLKSFITIVNNFLQQLIIYIRQNLEVVKIDSEFPELVYKCYHPTTLKELFLIRQYILDDIKDESIKQFLKLALTDTLRGAASAGTGWPYIAPRKDQLDITPKSAFPIFRDTVYKMYEDLGVVQQRNSINEIHNVLGDSRHQQSLPSEYIDFALTSPPYLNNYDYADRTRLETYFWGLANSWRDITEQYRNKLMVAATTQVVRSRYDVNTVLSKEIQEMDADLYLSLQNSISELAILRTTKGGKKDYDLMVGLYFNDLKDVIKETYRLLKRGSQFCLILGDSAPYGIHIPTEEVVGKMALGIGFSKYEYKQFRTRGDKWKANPQRHTIKLKEGMVILTK